MAETIALALIAGGMGMSAYSQYQAGKEARDIAKRNEQIAKEEAALISETARRNAALAQEEAERARYIRREEAREFRKEARRILAVQKARYAKAGVVAGAGTPLLVSGESKKQFARQAAIINETGIYEYGYGMSQAGMIRFAGAGQARLKLSEAAIYKKTGASAYKAGLWGAGTTLATGVGMMGMYGAGKGWFAPKTSPALAKPFQTSQGVWVGTPSFSSLLRGY